MTPPQMTVGPYSQTPQLQIQTRFFKLIGCNPETENNMTTPRESFEVSNIAPDHFTDSISYYQDHDSSKFMSLTNM